MAKKQTGHKKIKLLVLLLVVIALVIGGYLLIKRYNDDKSKPPTSTTSSQLKQEENNLNNQNKASLPPATKGSNTSSQTNSSSSNPGEANVFITYASDSDNTIQVSSYVSNAFENNGTCTLTLTNGSSTIKRQDTGIENVSYTTCPTFTIDNTNDSVLAAGTWNATVSYSSPAYQGTSSATSLKVQ